MNGKNAGSSSGVVSAIFGLLAETPVHPGAGKATGVIDLPIQREVHTAWPCIYASGVKGGLRQLAEESEMHPDDLRRVFGSEGNQVEMAGALAVGDASLLLLPVRSLTSSFQWVTCPEVLQRFKSACRRLGVATGAALTVPGNPALDDAIGTSSRKPESRLFLEEFRFTLSAAALHEDVVDAIKLCVHEDFHTTLAERLLVVHNDRFRWFAEHATQIAAHVKLDNETKAIERGALWYEETLPPETVMYVPLLASDSRELKSKLPASDVLTKVLQLFAVDCGSPYARFGGNESLAMGWCHVTVALADSVSRSGQKAR